MLSCKDKRKNKGIVYYIGNFISLSMIEILHRKCSAAYLNLLIQQTQKCNIFKNIASKAYDLYSCNEKV